MDAYRVLCLNESQMLSSPLVDLNDLQTSATFMKWGNILMSLLIIYKFISNNIAAVCSSPWRVCSSIYYLSKCFCVTLRNFT